VDAEAVEILLGWVDEALRHSYEGAGTLRGSEVLNQLLDLRVVVVEAGTVDWQLPVITPSRGTRMSRSLSRLRVDPPHTVRSA
jgi:hypothetical protein